MPNDPVLNLHVPVDRSEPGESFGDSVSILRMDGLEEGPEVEILRLDTEDVTHVRAHIEVARGHQGTEYEDILDAVDQLPEAQLGLVGFTARPDTLVPNGHDDRTAQTWDLGGVTGHDDRM